MYEPLSYEKMSKMPNPECRQPYRFDPWPLVGAFICAVSAAASWMVLWGLWKCLRW